MTELSKAQQESGVAIVFEMGSRCYEADPRISMATIEALGGFPGLWNHTAQAAQQFQKVEGRLNPDWRTEWIQVIDAYVNAVVGRLQAGDVSEVPEELAERCIADMLRKRDRDSDDRVV